MLSIACCDMQGVLEPMESALPVEAGGSVCGSGAPAVRARAAPGSSKASASRFLQVARHSSMMRGFVKIFGVPETVVMPP